MLDERDEQRRVDTGRFNAYEVLVPAIELMVIDIRSAVVREEDQQERCVKKLLGDVLYTDRSVAHVSACVCQSGPKYIVKICAFHCI